MGRLKNNLLIDDNVFFVLDAIEKRGYEARVVGGASRDFLLQRKISDVDIATSATPTEVIGIFSDLGLKTIPTGVKYGSITLLYKGKSYEITTLREDIKTFGRRAEVKFSKSFEEDSKRRDFTINAIYIDKNGKLYDYHSGIDDVFAGRIRFIGDARKRIAEDYLRILRYFRFTASHGDYKCDPKYLEIIDEMKSGVKILSTERIVSELLKIFDIPDSYRIIPPMKKVLDELFSLRVDSLAATFELGIFKSLTNVERLSMLLKFSNDDSLARRYDFPRKIKELLLLKPIELIPPSPVKFENSVKYALKKTPRSLRNFYVKFLAIDAYLNKGFSKADAKNFLEELSNFCKSEYIDFKLRADDLKEYAPTEEELKAAMIAAKEFWLDDDATRDECKKVAVERLGFLRANSQSDQRS
ncbi:MAG: CCA tRNA nucleotidyltransferase [Holosporaceae bacterium]|jgi:tRNA nucleotidyltransferase/poly(A) polymerase|nr:CCA tRNA nucleotidyltransferase [Holosporaceae bacterium]